jgi:predicted O-methyltransferase YrrM
MYESVRGRGKRVLVIGESADIPDVSPETLLAPDGLLIVMESNNARAAEMRRGFANHGLNGRATVIGGEPRRMVYKLAGPFDVIVCGPTYLSLLPMLEKLLAPDGVLITNVET